ncbi:hypothetical protein THMIRHAS_02030 [Thiosulfatimonas sediminis]|uniref:Uncharacterized protein n=1 Tax=Thiosulfatimonas sediminis TaxID=2675054 RepID=A0A6F8PS66_9GAMM|nr:hypothetical protein [Thiosulfatimonas sediminis]BBP44830.1 hypothetical protein THMIRHAS_02030 [Thiosulfatimonas sediminis]
MRYQVTEQEKHAAKLPHHIFNINVIITHLAISQVALELGGGSPAPFLLVPLISGLVILFLYQRSQLLLAENGSWFVAAHWTQAWRRGRNLLLSYAVATLVITLGVLLGNVFGGGLMMNDFSAEGSSTSIVEKISLFFGAIVVFFTVLYNFLQTGISVYDAGKGIIDSKIEKFAARNETANPELGEGDGDVRQDSQSTEQEK